jgi:hypothetical protein
MNSDNSKSGDAAKPEWIRIPEAVRLFGLSRSTLYELIGKNLIRSYSLCKRGCRRGTRLIFYDSLCEFMDQTEENGGGY